MPDYDTDAARQALEDAFDSEAGREQAVTPPESVTSEVEQTQRTTEQKPDTFTNLDPSTLAPELQTIYKSMQGDYTRTKQQLAERERAFANLGDPNEVQNAVQFVRELQDPNNLVQLHAELSEYLQTQGLTPAQADAAASKEIGRTQDEDEWGIADPDDDIRRELNELKKQNAELSQWREEQEAERTLSLIEQDVARKESFIRNENPDYKQDDIDRIYIMSYAFGGDLLQAQRAYEDMKSQFASEYMNSKGNVPSSLGPINPGTGAQVPDSFGRDLDAAHEYAKRRAAAEFNFGA